jgi:hypothetical protein
MKKIIFTIVVLILVANINFKSYKEEISFLNLKKGNHNKEYAILIDYSKNSSFNRMFLVNLNTGKILKSFKVAHGRGKSKYLSLKKEFSNKRGSNLSSLGVSILGGKNQSSWGLRFNYTINELDKTNSNNSNRNIVLHSWGGIQDYWIPFLPLPQSQGCPTISNKSLQYLDNFIKKQSNKKILIYSFNNG